MSAVVDTGKERAQCLEQVLEINPHNETAQRGLEALRQKQTTPPQAQVQPEASQIKIEFGFSTSPNYQRAVAIAQELSGYTTWGEGRKLRHQVTFVAEEVEEFLHLSGLARKWKSTTFWLNEKELAPPTPNYAS
jgi:hypothetical protein